MYFRHSSDIWRDFPELSAGVIAVSGITSTANVADRAAKYNQIATDRLANATESELPEIQAWRRTFSKMGLKPTQYRCASESLLRRFRKEGSLPQIHPLIDICNAISLAYATPIAAFDVSNVEDGLEVRYATGDERYLTFADETEHPEVHEVIFADAIGQAHARRWTNRQSGRSAIRETTSDVLIVAEALHDTASDDIARLIATIAEELTAIWSTQPRTAQLSQSSPNFEF